MGTTKDILIALLLLSLLVAALGLLAYSGYLEYKTIKEVHDMTKANNGSCWMEHGDEVCSYMTKQTYQNCTLNGQEVHCP